MDSSTKHRGSIAEKQANAQQQLRLQEGGCKERSHSAPTTDEH